MKICRVVIHEREIKLVYWRREKERKWKDLHFRSDLVKRSRDNTFFQDIDMYISYKHFESTRYGPVLLLEMFQRLCDWTYFYSRPSYVRDTKHISAGSTMLVELWIAGDSIYHWNSRWLIEFLTPYMMMMMWTAYSTVKFPLLFIKLSRL